MEKKNLSTYHETLYHLIMFRIDQFTSSKELLKIDYESFMICSMVASHINFHNIKNKNNFDWYESWAMARKKSTQKIIRQEKLTIFAISNILKIPKESVRRKIIHLVKQKLLKQTTLEGVTFGEKVELFRPFGKKEMLGLSKLIKTLKKTGALNQLLELQEKDLQ